MLELSKSLGVLYDLWKNDKSGERPFIVLPFAEMAQSLVNQNVNTCAFSEDGCQGVISISNDGSVYSCGRFSEDVDFLMGNIFDHSFNEILNSDVAKKRARRLCHIKAECSNCKYIKVCNGGCAQEAYAINNDYYKKTPYCSLYLSLFSKIEQDVNTMLALRKNL